MERDKCEGMINELIEFTNGYVWFGRDGIQTTIDYRIIEDISPSKFEMEEV